MSNGREMTFDDVLRYVGQEATRPGDGAAGGVPDAPASLDGTPGPPRPEDLFGRSGRQDAGCGSSSCGCRGSGGDAAALSAVTAPVPGFGTTGTAGVADVRRPLNMGKSPTPERMGAAPESDRAGDAGGIDGSGGFLEKPGSTGSPRDAVRGGGCGNTGRQRVLAHEPPFCGGARGQAPGVGGVFQGELPPDVRR
jgi:hypothetical protein